MFTDKFIERLQVEEDILPQMLLMFTIISDLIQCLIGILKFIRNKLHANYYLIS